MTSEPFKELQQLTFEHLDQLHTGVRAIRFLDFPDHTNVGDSAIALGSLAYWQATGVMVTGVHTLFSTPRTVLTNPDAAVALQGGGSFGGLYAPMNSYRLRVVRSLNARATLIQMPQSVHFPSEDLRLLNAEAFSERPTARVAARDRSSMGALESIGIKPILAPDAAHALGPLFGPPPRTEFVVLARTDPEAASRAGGLNQPDTFDWPRASIPGRVIHRIKHQRPWPDAAQRLAVRRPDFWIHRAQKQLDSGLPLLAAGRTVITDRLHAMILGLQLGRRVIAVDNANQKLTNYASTWLGAADIPLEFAETFKDALSLASRSQH